MSKDEDFFSGYSPESGLLLQELRKAARLAGMDPDARKQLDAADQRKLDNMRRTELAGMEPKFE